MKVCDYCYKEIKNGYGVKIINKLDADLIIEKDYCDHKCAYEYLKDRRDEKE